MQANELIEHASHQQMITKIMHMPSGYVDDVHAHPWHQIVFPLSGLLQSTIGDNSAIVPHNAMLYIPAHTEHKSVAVTETQFMAIYLNPGKMVQFGCEPKSFLATAFIKELILLLFEPTLVQHPSSHITHLLTVLRDQIEMASGYEIPLLIPKDKRLLSIFLQLKQHLDLPYTLKEWAQKVGASERTLSRICASEFKQSFSLWRQNIRLVLSLQRLDSDRSIQDIALELGYASDSAYIHAFKKLFNQTPRKYRSDYLAHRFTMGGRPLV